MKFNDNVEFMAKDFLLENEVVQRLYHEHTAIIPFFDDGSDRRAGSCGVLPQCAALLI